MARTVLRFNARQPRAKAHLAAEPQNFLPDGGDRLRQAIGAHMRVRLIENALGRAVRMQDGQHLAAAGILDAGGQFAVRKRARAALAELHVAVFIQRAASEKALHAPRTLIHALAALQADGIEARAGQIQRRKQAAGPHADHHRRVRARCGRGRGQGRVGRGQRSRAGL